MPCSDTIQVFFACCAHSAQGQEVQNARKEGDLGAFPPQQQRLAARVYLPGQREEKREEEKHFENFPAWK